jgi:hypothetical protein
MWSIGKIAQRTGCNIETIRYHERLSLLPEQHLEIIDDKLAHLQNIRTALAQLADRCRSDCACTKAPRCSLLEALAGQESVGQG